MDTAWKGIKLTAKAEAEAGISTFSLIQLVLHPLAARHPKRTPRPAALQRKALQKRCPSELPRSGTRGSRRGRPGGALPRKMEEGGRKVVEAGSKRRSSEQLGGRAPRRDLASLNSSGGMCSSWVRLGNLTRMGRRSGSVAQQESDDDRTEELGRCPLIKVLGTSHTRGT
ncbi:unnamed protein product [Prorocentrum cordatum]|uniref:Uncharacterized protein n=1 Tax=Prorocentrum cordatum TaxID=2364126 RepID=A0ABN9W6J1_9DINO|nr:unnamed protein product [Polarella glacialis]